MGTGSAVVDPAVKAGTFAKYPEAFWPKGIRLMVQPDGLPVAVTFTLIGEVDTTGIDVPGRIAEDEMLAILIVPWLFAMPRPDNIATASTETGAIFEPQNQRQAATNSLIAFSPKMKCTER